MNNKKEYTGFDYFRIVAAFLIVTIHTSPLSTYSESADFILTRIIARMAVPFFFMVSGFFLLIGYSLQSDKLKIFIKRTLLLYVFAIVIYIPINIYNGYFTRNNLLPNIIKDLVFDGTLYHLWYLPAAIFGAAIAWFLVKKLEVKWAFGITFLLYIIGLFGDSYFGVSEQIPFMKRLYEYMFQLSDYTRNGVFFAPIFFVLGGVIANQTIRFSLKRNLMGLIISISLMICEGLFLHRLGIQRHDSMYIMIVPSMYFLFSTLTFWQGHRVSKLRTSAMVIYIIHPMMIVVIRMFAKIFGLQRLLLENSILYFASVVVASVIAALAVLLLQRYLKKRKSTTPLTQNTNRSWIEVDLNNLKYNAKILQAVMQKGCELMAVVKAEAYGHGAIKVSACLNQMGVKAFAVATIEEGIELRQHGIQGEILILGYTNSTNVKQLHRYKLIQTVIDYNYACLLNDVGYDIKVHIKIDTGMHRLGLEKEDVNKIAEIFEFKHIEVSGIYTHLCVSDCNNEDTIEFTHLQISTFNSLIQTLTQRGIKLPKIHIQSSYGLLNYPELQCDYARIGIALYGVLSVSDNETKLQPDLRPVLALKSQIALIRDVKSGESIGYGRTFITKKDSRIAVLPIGYADGLPRNLSCGKSEVLINGSRVPMIGRICMDQLIIDITEAPEVEIGDTVTIIGRDGNDEISAAEVAENADSITNELLSRMGARLNRIYL